jgi:hypothetical protein
LRRPFAIKNVMAFGFALLSIDWEIAVDDFFKFSGFNAIGSAHISVKVSVTCANEILSNIHRAFGFAGGFTRNRTESMYCAVGAFLNTCFETLIALVDESETL